MIEIINRLILVALLSVTVFDQLIRVPVKGQIAGGYKINISIGYPLIKNQPIVLDTGSSLTSVPCSDCVKCLGSSDKVKYNPAESFTSSKPKCVVTISIQKDNQPICKNKCKRNSQYCEFSITYLQQTSIYGNIIRDNITFTSSPEVNFGAFFGCIWISDSIHINSSEDSIMGLSPDSTHNILYPLFQQYPSAEYTFSTCFKEEGGFMEIGPNPEDPEPTWVSTFDISKRLYLLNDVSEIRAGNIDLLMGYKPIVDTGTSFWVIPSYPHKIFVEYINQTCSSLGNCNFTSFTFEETKQTYYQLIISFQEGTTFTESYLDRHFSNITMVINGKEHLTEAHKYFLEFNKTTTEASFLLGIENIQEDMFIIGMQWMQDTKIVYNVEKQTVAAYYNYNCSYSPLPPQSIFTSLQKIIGTIPIIVISVVLVLAGMLLMAKCSSFLARKVMSLSDKLKRKKTSQSQQVQLNEEVSTKNQVPNEISDSNMEGGEKPVDNLGKG